MPPTVRPPGDDGPPAVAPAERALPPGRAGIRERMRTRRADLERQVQEGRARLDEANERIEARAGRNLILAIIIGVALGGTLLLSLIFYSEIFATLACIIVGSACFELAAAVRKAGYRVDPIPLVAAGVLMTGVSFFLTPGWRWAIFGIIVGVVMLWRLIASIWEPRKPFRERLNDVAISAFILAYVPFLASFSVMLAAREGGQWWVLAFIILVVVVDTSAYAAGLSFGKHPMAPKISPKKTWEGFAGAAVGAVIAGILLALFMLDVPWWVGVIFGLVLLFSATMGDLGESLIKRDLGIKDMSSWLPGHGGFLDRLDSLLPSAPIALAMFILFAPA